MQHSFYPSRITQNCLKWGDMACMLEREDAHPQFHHSHNTHPSICQSIPRIIRQLVSQSAISVIRPSVCSSVRLSVCPSIRPSVSFPEEPSCTEVRVWSRSLLLSEKALLEKTEELEIHPSIINVAKAL